MKRLLVLMLLSSMAIARDPFFPMENACSSHAAIPDDWHLLGVLGREGEWASRWRSPAGRGITLSVQAYLGESLWQIHTMDLNGVLISRTLACKPAHYHYALKKGRSDALMSSPRAVATGISQPGN